MRVGTSRHIFSPVTVAERFRTVMALRGERSRPAAPTAGGCRPPARNRPPHHYLRERTAELTDWSDVVGGSSIGGIWRFEWRDRYCGAVVVVECVVVPVPVGSVTVVEWVSVLPETPSL
jgi:hypothetical protein